MQESSVELVFFKALTPNPDVMLRRSNNPPCRLLIKDYRGKLGVPERIEFTNEIPQTSV
jgi:hypothetical protein